MCTQCTFKYKSLQTNEIRSQYKIYKDIHVKGAFIMTVINTRKLRKIGNSKVLTIPEEAIKALDVEEGQSIAFNVANGQVVLEAVKIIDDNERDILNIANQVSQQYDSALKDLVNR